MLAALAGLTALASLLLVGLLVRLLVGLLAVLARATTSTNGSGITRSREGFRLSTHLITYIQKKTYSGFWKTYRY